MEFNLAYWSNFVLGIGLALYFEIAVQREKWKARKESEDAESYPPVGLVFGTALFISGILCLTAVPQADTPEIYIALQEAGATEIAIGLFLLIFFGPHYWSKVRQRSIPTKDAKQD